MTRTATMAAAIAIAASLAPVAAGAAAAPATFEGLWTNNSLTQVERPDDFKTLVVPEAEARAYEAKHLGKPPELPDDKVGAADSEWWETGVGLAHIRGQARTSWIVSPADGQMPFNAAAKAMQKARHDRRKAGVFDNVEDLSPSERCISHDAAGPPMLNGGYNDNFRFVQTADRLVIVSEWMSDVRIIRIGDTRHPPKAIRSQMGDSIAHWEGRTLVVETTNFTPTEVDAPDRDADADMRVVERLTRTSPEELFYEFLVQAPASFVQDWRGEMVFHATPGPIYEFACHEGNYALPDILRGARVPASAAAGAR